MKKKNLGGKGAPHLSKEDVDDIMTMNAADLQDSRRELLMEAEQSQAEALAKGYLKLTLQERGEALKILKKKNVTLFETVEYILSNLMIK